MNWGLVLSAGEVTPGNQVDNEQPGEFYFRKLNACYLTVPQGTGNRIGYLSRPFDGVVCIKGGGLENTGGRAFTGWQGDRSAATIRDGATGRVEWDSQAKPGKHEHNYQGDDRCVPGLLLTICGGVPFCWFVCCQKSNVIRQNKFIRKV